MNGVLGFSMISSFFPLSMFLLCKYFDSIFYFLFVVSCCLEVICLLEFFSIFLLLHFFVSFASCSLYQLLMILVPFLQGLVQSRLSSAGSCFCCEFANRVVCDLLSFLIQFSFSLEGVGSFRLQKFFSISISSMRLLNSTTLGDGCDVFWVISSGCEFGVKLVWFASAFAFIDSFIDSFILLFILTAKSCMNYFMLSPISSLMSTIMESLRSFIISDSFQFADHSDSEPNVMSSQVSRVAVL